MLFCKRDFKQRIFIISSFDRIYIKKIINSKDSCYFFFRYFYKNVVKIENNYFYFYFLLLM